MDLKLASALDAVKAGDVLLYRVSLPPAGLAELKNNSVSALHQSNLPSYS
ncbi:hypothetical protein [Acinetobacter sp.]